VAQVFPPQQQSIPPQVLNVSPNQSVPREQLQEWERLGSLESQVFTHTGQISDLRKSVDGHQSTLDRMSGAWWALTGAVTVLAGIVGIMFGLFGRPIGDWAISRLRDYARPRVREP
jgi:hypothetical protein